MVGPALEQLAHWVVIIFTTMALPCQELLVLANILFLAPIPRTNIKILNSENEDFGSDPDEFIPESFLVINPFLDC